MPTESTPMDQVTTITKFHDGSSRVSSFSTKAILTENQLKFQTTEKKEKIKRTKIY